MQIAFRGAWPALAQPLPLGTIRARLGTTLRLDGNEIVLASTGGKEARRALGCTPNAVSVYTAHARGFGVVVTVATCATQLGHDEIVNVFPVGDDRVD